MTGTSDKDEAERTEPTETSQDHHVDLDTILTGLASEAWRERRVAAQAAAQHPNVDEIVSALLDMAAHGDPDQKAAASDALVEIGDKAAAGLAEHAFHLGERSDQRIGLLQQLLGLGHGNSRQGGGHVQQVAFIERRHEFRTQPAPRKERYKKNQHGNSNDEERVFERASNQRAVEFDEKTTERIFIFSSNFASNEIKHQHRDNRNREQRRRRHRKGFRIG